MDPAQATYPDIDSERIVTLASPTMAGLVTLCNAQFVQLAALAPPVGFAVSIEGLKLCGTGAGGRWMATIEWDFVDNDPTPVERPAAAMRVAGVEGEASNDQLVRTTAQLATAPDGTTLGQALQRAINALDAGPTTLWDVAGGGSSDGHRLGLLALCQITP